MSSENREVINQKDIKLKEPTITKTKDAELEEVPNKAPEVIRRVIIKETGAELDQVIAQVSGMITDGTESYQISGEQELFLIRKKGR